jgi:hypothetical protein
MTDKAILKETPYDDDVRELARENGLSLNRARDGFIWAGLQMGDVGPLVCFLLSGYMPGLALRHHLASMIAAKQSLPESVRRKLCFRFEIRSCTGKRGPRRSNFAIGLRNRQLAKRVKDLMAEFGAGSYEAAIKQVADETGWGKQTVRDSYDERKQQGKKTTN